MDILTNPFVTAFLAVVALLGTSFFTTMLMKAQGASPYLKPQTVVWTISAIIAAVALITGGTKMPAFMPEDPSGYITAWLLLATVWAKATQVLYDLLLKQWWPSPEPEPEPEPLSAPAVGPRSKP